MSRPAHHELRLLAPLGLAALLAACVPAMMAGISGGQWFAQAAAVWAGGWYMAWRRRGMNVPAPGAPPWPTLGWANRLTLLRGWLIAATAGFLLQSSSTGSALWMPAACYSLAAILDRLDGFVARRSGRLSEFGSALDTLFDALGLLVAPLLALQEGKIPAVYLLVSAAYYLFQAGLYRRRRMGLPTFALVPNTLRRTLAGFQMGFIAVVLWPVFQPPLTLVAGWAFMLPVLAGFAVDWLVVSGRIRAGEPASARAFAALEQFAAGILQPLLRLVALVALYATGLAGTSFPGIVLAGCGACVALGIASRTAALVMVLTLAGLLPDLALDAALGVLLFASVWIMLLGSGRYSLWQRDEAWIKRYDGA